MSERQAMKSLASASMARAILTDIHFWVPALVLVCGVVLLASIQAG